MICHMWKFNVFPGRTDEKKKCADKIAEDIADILGCDVSSVSVVIKDIPADEWKEKVRDADIIPNEKYLIKSQVTHVNKTIVRHSIWKKRKTIKCKGIKTANT